MLTVDDLKIGTGCPLIVISGPCVIESEDHALRTAAHLKKLFSEAGVQFIYKSSYDKANRTSIDSYRGPGLEEGLRILERVASEFDLPVFTDVHTPEEARAAAEVCAVIQIPAFLCRQTDLLVAAAQTGAVVNIKKGQFLAPWDVKHAVDKVTSSGNARVSVTERGTSFGYNNLISDMRAFPVIKELGHPVLFDATHSLQLPGGLGSSTGGQRHFLPTLARAALAAGADGIYAESHPNPAHAKSDSTTVIPFEALPYLINEWKTLHQATQACLESTHSSALSSS